jgi:hypothetical protein
MSFCRNWIMGTIVILSLLTFNPFAQAQQTYDFTACLSGTLLPASASKEVFVASHESRGICRSNHENKVFDNCSWHAVGASRVFEGKRTAIEYTRVEDLDGDYVVMEGNWGPAGLDYKSWGGKTKFLEGTGKWKGIKGEGKSERILTSKPIDERSWQSCSRFTGTFELPK